MGWEKRKDMQPHSSRLSYQWHSWHKCREPEMAHSLSVLSKPCAAETCKKPQGSPTGVAAARN